MNKPLWMMMIACVPCFTGCVTVSPENAFRDVQGTVATRIERRVEWRRGTDADAAVDAEVRDLLKRSLSVDEAVQIALLNNRNLQAVYEELGMAQADLVEAGLLQNPIFEVQYRLPGRPANPYELHLVQDFIDLFYIPLRRKIASAALESAKFRVANVVLEHAAETRRSFYRLQAAEQLVDMRKTVLEATEASALLAKRQHEAGNISDLDLANEQALFEQSKVALVLAQVEVLEAREHLNELMGLAGNDVMTWTVDPRLPDLPSCEAGIGELESLAVSQRLDLLAARQEIESLAQSVGLTRVSALIPSLDVGGHVEREPDGPTTWGPSVGLPLPIFNQGQPAVARVASKLRQSQQRYLALAVKVQVEVRSARNRMLLARRVAGQYQSVMLPLRRKIVEESQFHYNAMQIGPFQLLQAKQAQLEAGGEYIEALGNYWVAFADLERAVGGRLGAPHSLETPREERETVQDTSEPATHGEHR